MSTSRHINKICIAVVAVMLVVTLLFLCGSALGVTAVAKTMKYESTLFDTSYVHQIDIVMDDWEGFLETCENEEYAMCTVVVDGKKHANIGIRAKGNTSLSSVRSSGSQRYSFKLEFDQYEKGKTLDGLDKLCLNNLIQDNTMMKDYLVYRMMDEFGADSPLCSYVWLTVNGEDWGLYLAVEGVEDSFLARNYGSDPGDLYKPDSLSFGGGRGNGKDFNMDDLDFGDGESETEGGGTDTQPAQPSGGDSGSGQQGGFSFDGQFPGFGGEGSEGGFSFDGQFPGFGGEGSEGGFSFDGQFPGMPGGEGSGSDGQQGSIPSGMQPPDQSGQGGQPGGMPGGGFSFGGMGSSDVKLQYIDDDPASYSNIFSSAKTDVTETDQERLIESLKKLSSYSDLESVLDLDEVLRYFVVHIFVCNGDSYTGSMIHNYYLHEKDGQMSMIPWDYNLAFGTFQGGSADSSVNASIDSPTSGSADDRPMVGWIFSDESYTEQYHALFAEFLETWCTSGKLETLISETAEMLRPYVEKDPTKFCTTEEFEAGVTALSSFVSLRTEAVSRQLAGDTTAVETNGLNLSDMGSMGGGKGGFGGNMPGGSGLPEGFGGTMPEGFGGSFPQSSGETAPADSGLNASEPSGASLTQTASRSAMEESGETMPEGFTGTMPEGFGGGTPPEGFGGGTPPEGFSGGMPGGADGTMPEGFGGGTPPEGFGGGTPPDGFGGGMPGGTDGTMPEGFNGGMPSGGDPSGQGSGGTGPNAGDPSGQSSGSAAPNAGDPSDQSADGTNPNAGETAPDASGAAAAPDGSEAPAASGESSGRPSRGSSKGQSGFSGRTGESGTQSTESGKQQFPGGSFSSRDSSQENDQAKTTWILLGASVLALAAGLLVAFLKKRW